MAFDLTLSILTSLFSFIPWIFALLCQPSHGYFMLIPHSMGHLSHPSLGSHSSFPHHYVPLCLTLPIFTWHGASLAPQLRQPLIFSTSLFGALCLTLPIFTWLFYVNTSWNGASLAPQLRQPLIFSTSFSGSLPYSANLRMAILCEYLMAWGIFCTPA